MQRVAVAIDRRCKQDTFAYAWKQQRALLRSGSSIAETISVQIANAEARIPGGSSMQSVRPLLRQH